MVCLQISPGVLRYHSSVRAADCILFLELNLFSEISIYKQTFLSLALILNVILSLACRLIQIHLQAFFFISNCNFKIRLTDTYEKYFFGLKICILVNLDLKNKTKHIKMSHHCVALHIMLTICLKIIF